MAIEKMSLVNLIGSIDDLEDTLEQCCINENFHPEATSHLEKNARMFLPAQVDSFYPTVLQRLTDAAANLSIPLGYTDFRDLAIEKEQVEDYLTDLEDSYKELNAKRQTLLESISQHERAIVQVKHLAGLDVSFDDIFACKYVKVRFGVLPADSYAKLEYYKDYPFFFFSFDHDDNYHWGVYFMPASREAEIDDIFNTMFFERMRVPDYVHETPDKAIENLNAVLADEKAQLQEVENRLKTISDKESNRIKQIYAKLKFLSTADGLKKFVSVLNDKFYLQGFVPQRESQAFIRSFERLESVSCVAMPPDADPSLKPPTKLRNNRLFRPFEGFIEMYGLPGYHDMDPTWFVALTYTILFGIMFGDLGQGILLCIVGALMWKFKQMFLGRILTRCGVASAIFGTLYGSVFGYEDLLNPLYQKVFGLESKPIHLLDGGTTGTLLLVAVAIGAVIIVASILLNIYSSLRKRDFERALFGPNGVAGLVFYVFLLAGLALMIFSGINLFNPATIILCIVLPLVLMFLKEPLGKVLKRRKDLKPEDGIGSFIIESFFELFDYVLSYVTNTVSFLRVGGFVLSHACMMAVVMTLSEMMGAIGSPIMVIFGNLFVMGLEGLIVGIQVLRLEYYESFSRFYDGDGEPFTPVKVVYTPAED